MAKTWFDFAGDVRPVIPTSSSGVPDWRDRISDHIAYALLVYTALQIGLTMLMMSGPAGTALPFVALISLVCLVLPGCRLMEKRWHRLDDAQATSPALADSFRRDCACVWCGALALPVVMVALFRGIILVVGA